GRPFGGRLQFALQRHPGRHRPCALASARRDERSAPRARRPIRREARRPATGAAARAPGRSPRLPSLRRAHATPCGAAAVSGRARDASGRALPRGEPSPASRRALRAPGAAGDGPARRRDPHAADLGRSLRRRDRRGRGGGQGVLLIGTGVAVYRRLFVYLKPHLPLLLVGGALAFVVAGMEGAIAWLVKPAMDGIFIRHDVAMLTLIPLLLFGAYVVKGIARYGQSYLMVAVGERVIASLRRTLYRHIQTMPLSFFSDRHSADLMSRIITDVNRLARLSSTVLVMTIRQVALMLSLVCVMFVREWRLSLIALLVFPLIGVTVRAIGRRLYRINKRSQEKIAELNVLLHEALAGTKIVKAFGREAHEAGRFDRVNDRLLAPGLKDHRPDEITEPLMEIVAALGVMGALWYGGHQVISGAMTPGDFFSFTAALALLYGPVRQLSRIVNTVQQSTASVERVFEVLDMPP